MFNDCSIRRWRRSAALIALSLACLASVPQRSMAGGLPVHDGTNLIALEEQIRHATTQIDHLAEQLTNQASMLASLRLNTTEEVHLAMAWVQRALVISRRIDYLTYDLERRFESLYPEDFSQVNRRHFHLLRTRWQRQNRWAVLEAMRVQASAVEAMPTDRDRIARVMDASQMAEGQTAAIQANTQLMATLSKQSQQLQALQISATRMEVAREAQQSATLDYYRQRRINLYRDKNTLPHQVHVADPFPHAR